MIQSWEQNSLMLETAQKESPSTLSMCLPLRFARKFVVLLAGSCHCLGAERLRCAQRELNMPAMFLRMAHVRAPVDVKHWRMATT